MNRKYRRSCTLARRDNVIEFKAGNKVEKATKYDIIDYFIYKVYGYNIIYLN